MCFNFFKKLFLKNTKILPCIICSHCSHYTDKVNTLSCGHLICEECLQVINIMTNDEKKMCIICARNKIRNITINK
jgi:hypothetical protein